MIEKGTAVGCPFEIVKKTCHCEEEHRPDVQSVTPVLWPPCERPIPLVKGKCPEGTKGIGRPNGPTWQSVPKSYDYQYIFGF